MNETTTVEEDQYDQISVKDFPGYRPMIWTTVIIIAASIVGLVVPLVGFDFWAGQTGATPATYLLIVYGYFVILVGFVYHYWVQKEEGE